LLETEVEQKTRGKAAEWMEAGGASAGRRRGWKGCVAGATKPDEWVGREIEAEQKSTKRH
jgi:hypothetical protein